MTVAQEYNRIFILVTKELIGTGLKIDFALVLTDKAAFVFHAGTIVRYEENLYQISEYCEYLKMSYLTIRD